MMMMMAMMIQSHLVGSSCQGTLALYKVKDFILRTTSTLATSLKSINLMGNMGCVL